MPKLVILGEQGNDQAADFDSLEDMMGGLFRLFGLSSPEQDRADAAADAAHREFVEDEMTGNEAAARLMASMKAGQ